MSAGIGVSQHPAGPPSTSRLRGPHTLGGLAPPV